MSETKERLEDPVRDADGRVHLAVYDRKSSIRRDGTHDRVVTADVSGRFLWARRAVFVALVVFWAALPWIPIDGHPAVFLDVPLRRFYLFGAIFNAQDTYLAFFGVTAVLFALVALTTLVGRAWCAWACPQTVFLEGLFRPIERWIEGPRNTHLARDAGGWSLARVWRKALKHFVFVFAAACVAHIFLAYFVSVPSVFEMVRGRPEEHPEAFVWMFAVTVLLYANFGHFREQLCLVVCPYGRLQSILVDDDSLTVGYDEKRGEPRGKGKRDAGSTLGACVDCSRCVAVCPTGIDIRNGLQIDCIACTQCVDACDEVMDRLHQPRGLVRYDSLRGLRGEPRRFFRPRLVLYAVLGVVGLGVGSAALAGRSDWHAQLLRLPGIPYVVEGELVRNSYELHLSSERDVVTAFSIEATCEIPGAELTVPETVELAPLGGERITVVVRAPRANLTPGARVTLRVSAPGDEPRRLDAPFLGPLPRRESTDP